MPKARADREHRWLWVLGRMKPKVSIEQAKAEMLKLAKRQADAYPDSYKGYKLRAMPLREFVAGDLNRQYTLLLLGAVASCC